MDPQPPSTEQLLQLLHQARQQAEEERQRANKERDRANKEQDRAQEERRQRADELDPSPAYRKPRYPLNPLSSYLLRNRKARTIVDPDTHTILDRDPRQRSTTNTEPSGSTTQTNSQKWQYCTQRCLSGLYSRSPLDPNCPNAHFHEKYSKNGLHPISLPELVLLMETQINKDPDCCHPLNMEGSHGSLFHLSLKEYGYTFVGKGTTYNSEYEARIYQRLRQLQGTTVPVYLGDVYLRESVYFLRADCIIIHMSLMAWGGTCLTKIESLAKRVGFKDQIKKAQEELLSAGVEHMDLEERNMLWNEEVQRVMIIDFGRVKVHQVSKRTDVLAINSPNRKRVKA
ncbi:hypothetical protein FQN57_001955 [Myotisia sp. PD_48]|nr:hypothetical protein FQN57_001955 [Myotisia sp. PD_48]